jgi:hypothetical protein
MEFGVVDLIIISGLDDLHPLLGVGSKPLGNSGTHQFLVEERYVRGQNRWDDFCGLT